jgi:hypothetical protein
LEVKLPGLKAENMHFYFLTTPSIASVAYWSDFLDTNPEILGSIAGATRFSEK